MGWWESYWWKCLHKSLVFCIFADELRSVYFIVKLVVVMEDFIEIIFYVVILVLSGIGSLMKNRKKQEKTESAPKQEMWSAESELEGEVVDENVSEVEEENELVRMLREAAAAAEAQQREKEALEQRQRDEELRRRELAEKARKAELLRLERERELAKQPAKVENKNLDVDNVEDNSVLGLDLSDVNEVRRAFIASEVLNKRYS